MKILQLFYTSCEKGLSPGKGFQTYSMSEGITDNERSEIERYGVYIPPHNLPSQPTLKEIETHFPIAFTFFQLGSGRYGVCQSKYTGQDYSGRYGNYFCHALIIDKGYWPYYPIQLWSASVFRDQLTSVDQTPAPLPALPINDLHLNQNINFETVAAFLKQDKRGAILPKILTAIIDYEQSHRRLILCDHQENIPYWIAALQMAFPIRLAHTFTTYSYDPEKSNLLICSTPPHGTRFAFSDRQRDFEFYIFDFIGEKTSQLQSHYEFNQLVKVSYSFSKDSLTAFHQFLDLFDYHKINPEIENAYYLFRISSSSIEELDNDKIIAALDFANTYAPANVLAQLSEGIDHILDAIADQVDIKTAEFMTRFLFKVARKTKSNQHFDTAYYFFFNALDSLIIDGALKLNETLISLDKAAHRKEFVERSIEPKRLHKITKNFLKTPKSAEIYFRMTVNNLIVAGYTWEQCTTNAKFNEFIKTCFDSLFQSKEQLCEALTAVATQNYEFFAQLVTVALTQAPEDSSVEMILECFTSAIPEKKTLPSRTRLLELGQELFVYKEFLQLLEEAKDKPQFFWDYHKTIFSKWRNFSNHYFSLAVKAYIKILPSSQITTECAKLLSNESLISEDGTMTLVIQKIEENFSFSPPSPKKQKKLRLFLSDLLALKEKRNIESFPDITRLALFAMDIESQSLSQFDMPSLEGLNVDRYGEYLDWILPKLFDLKPTAEQHGILFSALKVDGIVFERKLILRYIAHLEPELVMNLMVFYLTLMPKTPELALLHRLLWRDIVDILAKMPTSFIKDIGALPETSDGLETLKALEREIEEQPEVSPKKGFIKSLFFGN
jgi:hypothetical protein